VAVTAAAAVVARHLAWNLDQVRACDPPRVARREGRGGRGMGVETPTQMVRKASKPEKLEEGTTKKLRNQQPGISEFRTCFIYIRIVFMLSNARRAQNNRSQ